MKGWRKFTHGLMSIVKPVASVAKSVLPMVMPGGTGSVISSGLGAVGLGMHRRRKIRKSWQRGSRRRNARGRFI